MTDDGAIMLAEFLPESTSLLHLDLTQNSLGMAGVMALSNGLKVSVFVERLSMTYTQHRQMKL
jgi:protein phosphatase 1 regulatory subunit 37